MGRRRAIGLGHAARGRRVDDVRLAPAADGLEQEPVLVDLREGFRVANANPAVAPAGQAARATGGDVVEAASANEPGFSFGHGLWLLHWTCHRSLPPSLRS